MDPSTVHSRERDPVIPKLKSVRKREDALKVWAQPYFGVNFSLKF